MTAFEYIMPSEYGNHGVHENIDETFIKVLMLFASQEMLKRKRFLVY